jgi:hypothetical protein
VKLKVTKKEEDHVLKRYINQEAKKMKKEYLQSEIFKQKEQESEHFFKQVRDLTNWPNFSLKKVNSFSSLLYCYE